MNINITKFVSKEDLVETLKRAPGFPQYANHNWDSIEESLAELLSNSKEVVIHNDFTPQEGNAVCKTFIDILASLQSEFQNLKIIFKTQ